MNDVLPPQSGLAINGMLYQYTTNKDPNSDMTVTIRNENALDPSQYIFENTDDWSKLPGNTINKRLTLPETSATLYGKGEIVTTGEGQVSNPSVVYEYRYDECYNPLYSPSCPGYWDALYAFLKEQGLSDREPDINDPYYDEWVQWSMRESENQENEEMIIEETEEENEEIEKLNGDATLEALSGVGDQEQIMIELATIPEFDVYYTANISGGVYEDTVKLEDGVLPDNPRVLRNLASDAKHKTMVRSQYKEIKIGE